MKKNTKNLRAIPTRKMIAICALSLASGAVFAQQGFDVGLRGIIQTSSLLNATDQAAGHELDYKNKVTGGGGIGAGYNFNNHVGVGLDIMYSKQGQGYIGDLSQLSAATNGVRILSQEFAGLALANSISLNTNYTARIEMSCMKIPILFRYTGDATKPWFFSSFIGPQINMLNSVLVQVNGQTASFSSANVKPEDLYNKTTFDAVLGLGVGINLSDNILLGIHLRLDYGLSDAEKKSATSGGDKWWDSGRAASNNATGGGLISLNYKFIKKAPKPGAPAATSAPKKK